MALGNLAQRFLVAVVAVPLLLLLLHYERPEPTWAVLFVASLIAMHEFFAMTLPAVSKHLAVLRRAGLVHGRREGREIRYRARPQGLGPVVDWMQRYAALRTVFTDQTTRRRYRPRSLE